MNQPIPNQTNKIDVRALKTIYGKPAPYANNFYLTQVNGLFRLSFAESVPDIKDEVCGVGAVTLTVGDLLGLANMLEGTAKQIMEQMKKQQEKASAVTPDVANKEGTASLDDLIANILPPKNKSN